MRKTLANKKLLTGSYMEVDFVDSQDLRGRPFTTTNTRSMSYPRGIQLPILQLEYRVDRPVRDQALDLQPIGRMDFGMTSVDG